MTICALQTQTSLDDDLRLIIWRGANCLHDKNLVQELLQETVSQTLAENYEWIQILQQQNLQYFKEIDGQRLERITSCLENATKLVALAPETVTVFPDVALPLFLFKGENRSITATSLQDSSKTAATSLKLDTPSTTTKMVEEIPLPEHLFTCSICQKTFSLWKTFVQHICHHSRGRPHKCNVCSKAFPYSSHLVRHIRTHTGEKPFSCIYCDKLFSDKSSLERHRRIHTGERLHKCTMRPKMFAQSEHLVVHTRRHTGEKPFVCSVCHKGFASSWNLKNHSRTHTGEKPFTCDICNKSFALKGTLNYHKRIHTREASDLQLLGCPSGQDGVPIAPSVSPSTAPSAERVCNLPEQLAANLSRPGSHPASSFDMPLEGRCDMDEVTPLKLSTLFLLLQDLDNLFSS